VESKLEDNKVVIAITAKSGGNRVLSKARAVVRLA